MAPRYLFLILGGHLSSDKKVLKKPLEGSLNSLMIGIMTRSERGWKKWGKYEQNNEKGKKGRETKKKEEENC